MLQLGPTLGHPWFQRLKQTRSHWCAGSMKPLYCVRIAQSMNSGCRNKRILRISLRELQLCCEIFRGFRFFFSSGCFLRIARNLAGLLEWEDSGPALTPVLLGRALAGKWEMVNYASISQLLLTKGFLPRYVSLLHPVCNNSESPSVLRNGT